MSKITGKVNCGDWIFPSKTSTSGVQYNIEKPIVLELFLQNKEKESPIATDGPIDRHLHGPRFLEVEIESDKLTIKTMKNRNEDSFHQSIDWSCGFNIDTLNRTNDFFQLSKDNFEENIANIESNGDRLAILFTSILLQHHTSGSDFIDGITFRDATIAEIESLGTWRHRLW